MTCDFCFQTRMVSISSICPYTQHKINVLLPTINYPTSDNLTQGQRKNPNVCHMHSIILFFSSTLAVNCTVACFDDVIVIVDGF